MAKYKMNGFLFDTEEEAQKAKKEVDAIRYIRSQTRMNDPEVILRLYNRLIEQSYFETPVGIGFLRELQAYLDKSPHIKNEDITPIPVTGRAALGGPDGQSAQEQQWNQQAKPAGEQRYRKLFHMTGTLCIMLLLIVVGMFVITYRSGTDMNIFNYEQQVIDKYEAWEQELTEREAAVLERERALDEKSAE